MQTSIQPGPDVVATRSGHFLESQITPCAISTRIFQMPASAGTLKSAAVVAATNIPMAKLNRWSDRKIITMRSKDKKAGGKGVARGFSLGRIYQIAIAFELTKLKIPAKDAMALAAKFEEPQRGRELGKLFPLGHTLLVARTDGTGEIVNLPPDGDLQSLFTDDATVVANLNGIISRVTQRLGTTIQ